MIAQSTISPRSTWKCDRHQNSRPVVQLESGEWSEFTDCGVFCVHCGMCLGCVARQWSSSRWFEGVADEMDDLVCPVAVAHLGMLGDSEDPVFVAKLESLEARWRK